MLLVKSVITDEYVGGKKLLLGNCRLRKVKKNIRHSMSIANTARLLLLRIGVRKNIRRGRRLIIKQRQERNDLDVLPNPPKARPSEVVTLRQRNFVLPWRN